VAHPVTSHIEPLAAQARPLRTREHRIKHDTRTLDLPQRPVGAMNILVLGAHFFALAELRGVRLYPFDFVGSRSSAYGPLIQSWSVRS
jgi:hypothetical protein